MEVLLEIKDNKAEFFIELLKNFSFVKVKKQSGHIDILKNIAQGLKEVDLVEKGKLKSRSAKSFLDEL